MCPSPARDTGLVLTNAVYFLGRWSAPFYPEATRPTPFFTAPGVSRPVPTMHDTGERRYAELPGLQALEHAYRGDVSMLILLPTRVDGVRDLERALDAALHVRILCGLEPRRVSVALPSFRLETDHDLTPTLMGMGIQAAFDPLRADLRADPISAAARPSRPIDGKPVTCSREVPEIRQLNSP